MLYDERHESRTLPWVKCQIFMEILFICNNIDKNLIKNFHSYLLLFQTVIFIVLNLCDRREAAKWRTLFLRK